jgi:hypothetical protein
VILPVQQVGGDIHGLHTTVCTAGTRVALVDFQQRRTIIKINAWSPCA